MKNDILVAVWMVTYNHESYIEEAIISIVSQRTTFKYKLFIGEDFSTDNTRNLCLELKNKYPDQIELLLSDKNIGPMRNAVNVYESCLNSSAKYIALCEGDDYWTDPLKLQKQVDFLEGNPNYNICYHNIKILNQQTGQLEEDNITRKVTDTTTIVDLAKGNFIHTPSVMLRTNFKIPNWFTKSFTGDWTLYMLSIKDKKVKKINEEMAVYRVHNNSNWSSKSEVERNERTKTSLKLVYSKLNLDKKSKQILKRRIESLSKPTVLDKVVSKTKKILRF